MIEQAKDRLVFWKELSIQQEIRIFANKLEN